jgi:hypothetical protein
MPSEKALSATAFAMLLHETWLEDLRDKGSEKDRGLPWRVLPQKLQRRYTRICAALMRKVKVQRKEQPCPTMQ